MEYMAFLGGRLLLVEEVRKAVSALSLFSPVGGVIDTAMSLSSC